MQLITRVQHWSGDEITTNQGSNKWMNLKEPLNFSYICKKGVTIWLATSLSPEPKCEHLLYAEINEAVFASSARVVHSKGGRKGGPQPERDLFQGKGHFLKDPPPIYQSTCAFKATNVKASFLPGTAKRRKANPQVSPCDELCHLLTRASQTELVSWWRQFS